MKFRTKADDYAERFERLRAAILLQAKLLYPQITFRRHLVPFSEELDLSEDDLDLAIHWLCEKGLATLSYEKLSLGRKDREFRLTASGVDAAIRIDKDDLRIPDSVR
jgi:hypothetical protein